MGEGSLDIVDGGIAVGLHARGIMIVVSDNYKFGEFFASYRTDLCKLDASMRYVKRPREFDPIIH